MHDGREPAFPWRKAVWAAASLAALFAAHNSYIPGNNPPDWTTTEILINQIIVWTIWLALLPVILAAARLWWASRRGPAAVITQVVIGVAMSMLHPSLAAIARWGTGIAISRSLDGAIMNSITSGFAPNVVRYALIAAACHAFLYHHHVRAQDARAARLEAGAVEAQLEGLRARLHPHFLFNTLNSIAALVVQNPQAAQDMIERLGELLRAALAADGRTQVTLGEELALLRDYTEIQKMRFQERLDVRFQVPFDLHGALVPQLILQPIVENAIRHGIAPLEAGGRITIKAAASGDTLQLSVEDDGVDPDFASAPAGTGFGVNGTRARLSHLYGPRGRFTIEARQPRGAVAIIELPLQRSGDDTSGHVA